MIAALGAGTADGAELGAVAAAYVLMTAVLGPVITKHADRIAGWWMRRRAGEELAPTRSAAT